jgi:hypothetical protein
MDRPPLDSDPTEQPPARAWTETLVAEWTDRGLSEGDEQSLRDTPKRLMLAAIYILAM